MQFNPFLKEYISFNLESHSEGTTLSCTRKSYGPFSFMSVWGFDSSKSKILDNLGYLIPQEDFTSSKDKSIKSLNKKNKTELSQIVAESLAKKAKEKKITKIYFDRGIYKYHGRVKTFADTLRKNGMEF